MEWTPEEIKTARTGIEAFCQRSRNYREHDLDTLAIDLACQRNALREALTKLTNETSGWLDFEPIELAGLFGNTNIVVMRNRVEQARAALLQAGGE